MTIISVNYTSPWYRLTDYAIPADLPECPDDGCICTWNWVHLAGHGEGDGEEIVSLIPIIVTHLPAIHSRPKVSG